MTIPHTIPDLDFGHLRAFLVLARLENFSRSGEELGLSQSAVSRHIRALEDSLGVPLFARLGRRVVLTPAGKVLRHHLGRLMREAEALPRVVKDLAEGVQGELRIGACLTAASALLPPLLGKYRRKYPDVRLMLEPSSSPRALKALARGELDLAFVVSETVPSGLDILGEIPDELLLLAAPTHALGRGRVKASKLDGCDFIHREPTSDTRERVGHWMQVEKIQMRPLMDVW